MHSAERLNLIAQVTSQLRTEITGGRWAVGARIPPEPELARLTGTGRNTVREAVQALVHTGMLERQQGRGTFVVADSELAGLLTGHLAASRRRDGLELRHALDVHAAVLAAQRRDSGDIAELTRLVAHCRAAERSRDDARYAVEDFALHRGLLVISRNALYLGLYDSLHTVGGCSLPNHAVNDHAGHHELVNAVIDGDVERAETAARRTPGIHAAPRDAGAHVCPPDTDTVKDGDQLVVS